MRLRLQRVPEEDQKIDFVVDDLRADLLIAAQRAALEIIDFQAQLLFQSYARPPGGVDFMVGEQIVVEFGPFQQVALLFIMRYQGNLLIRNHDNLLVRHTAYPILSVNAAVLSVSSIDYHTSPVDRRLRPQPAQRCPSPAADTLCIISRLTLDGRCAWALLGMGLVLCATGYV